MDNFLFLLVILLTSTLVFADQLAYEPRHTYKYDYTFSVNQGNAGSQAQDAHDEVTIKLQALVEFYCYKRDETKIHFTMRIPTVEVLGNGGDRVSQNDAAKYATELRRYPADFAMDAVTGRVPEIAASIHDPEWVKNIKKGILSVFQHVKVDDGNNQYSVMESDSFGEDVDTIYTVTEDEEFYIYTRSKSVERENVFSAFESRQFVSKGRKIVEKIEFADKHLMLIGDDAGISANGDGRLNLHESSLDENYSFFLSETERVSEGLALNLDQSADVSEDEFSADRSVDVTDAVNLAREYAKNPANGRMFVKLVSLLSESKYYIESIKPFLSDLEIRQVLLDALTSTGLDEAIIAALDSTKSYATEENTISFLSQEEEAPIVRIIMGSAYSSASSPKIVDFNVKLMKNQGVGGRVRGAAALALGNLLFAAGEEKVKRDRYLRNGLASLVDSLQKADNDKDRVLYLHALGNAGQTSTAALVVSYGVEQSEEVRKAAVFSLRRVKSVVSVHPQLTAIVLDDVNSEIQIAAFKHILKELTVAEAVVILKGLKERQSQTLVNVIELIKQSPLYPQLKDVIDNIGTVPKPPLYRRAEEIFIVGEDGMGATVGYDILINNPLAGPADDAIVAHTEAYSNVYALKKKFSVFDGFARLQGDLIYRGPNDRAVESFLYFSIGGSVWSECIDLLGEGCSKIGNVDFSVAEQNCFEKSKNLVSFSSNLFKSSIRFPLPYGLSLNFETAVAGFLYLDAAATACSAPYKGSVALIPRFGMDVVGDSNIDAILVRAGISVDAQVLHTNVTAKAFLDFGTQPKQICANVHVDQNAVKADFEFWAQIRDDLKWCGKIPCGLGWGHAKSKTLNWDGFSKGKFSKDLHKSCFEWRGAKSPRHAQLVLQ